MTPALRSCLLVAALLIATSANAFAQLRPPLFVLYPVIGAVEDRFGNDLAATDRRVLVGSYLEDQPGATSLYSLEDGAPLATFADPNPTELSDNDGFGSRVAVSNRLLAIVRGVPPAIFVYDRRGRQLGTVDVSDLGDACDDVLDVAIHGKRIAASTRCGVLVIDWPGRRLFVPAPQVGPDDLFGIAIAMTGRRVYVGSIPNTLTATSSGSVFAFDARTGVSLWETHAPGATPRDGFGVSLATAGSRLLVGAPGDGTDIGAVYLLDGVTGTVRKRYANPSGLGGEGFGGAVAGDGHLVVVGAPQADVDENGAGVAYVLDGRNGILLEVLAPRPNDEDAHAGRAVAVTRSRILVGGSDWSGIGMVAAYAR
jgi:hypothetical protein